MKMLTVEIVKSQGIRRAQVAGRSCREAIHVGDTMQIEGIVGSLVKVSWIDVYGKRVEELHHGYVGTLEIEIISGPQPLIDSVLVAEGSDRGHG